MKKNVALNLWQSSRRIYLHAILHLVSFFLRLPILLYQGTILSFVLSVVTIFSCFISVYFVMSLIVCQRTQMDKEKKDNLLQ